MSAMEDEAGAEEETASVLADVAEHKVEKEESVEEKKVSEEEEDSLYSVIQWSEEWDTPVLPFKVDPEKHQTKLRDMTGHFCNEIGVMLNCKSGLRGGLFPSMEGANEYVSLTQTLVKDLLIEHCDCIPHEIPFIDSVSDATSAKSTDSLDLLAPSIALSTLDYMDCNRLCLVIPGTGIVRHGVWASSILTKQSFWFGSMLPYIHYWSQRDHTTIEKESIMEDDSSHNTDDIKEDSSIVEHLSQPKMAVVICDPNAKFPTGSESKLTKKKKKKTKMIESEITHGSDLNAMIIKQKTLKTDGASLAHAHVWHVFENLVKPWLLRNDKQIHNGNSHFCILAHSAGGGRTTKLLNRLFIDARDGGDPTLMINLSERLFAIAFTDILDPLASKKIVPLPETLKLYAKYARNWKRTDHPLDTIVKARVPDDDDLGYSDTPSSERKKKKKKGSKRVAIDQVSAGHADHKMTSAFAFKSVIRFFQDKMEHKLGGSPVPLFVEGRDNCILPSDRR